MLRDRADGAPDRRHDRIVAAADHLRGADRRVDRHPGRGDRGDGLIFRTVGISRSCQPKVGYGDNAPRHGVERTDVSDQPQCIRSIVAHQSDG